jgi:multidrug efflux pump subunit AcrA (membrane-fusion protein)
MFKKVIWLGLVVLLLAGCAQAQSASNLTASGMISANRFDVASEMGGKVSKIFYEEGSVVHAGDVLFELDDEVIVVQRAQAEAAVETADAGLLAAQRQLEAAQIQLQRAEQGARLMELQRLQTQPTVWNVPLPTQFAQPGWYYAKEENLMAAEREVASAQAAVDKEKANLQTVQAKSSNGDFMAMEQSLADARVRFLVAEQTLNQANAAADNAVLKDMAQKEYDAALSNLETVQRDYDRMLTTTAANEILEARAKLAVALARLENAQNVLDTFQTGDLSLDVQAARAAVLSAEALVEQAKAGQKQAKAALDLLDLQQKKMTVTSPVDGVILTRNVEVGELIGAGMTVMTIGQLDSVRLTVYVPEDVYGRIAVQQSVRVTVDSFPERVFDGQVLRIADEAEFTPRNVQTVEGRKATVYAVEIVIPNPDWALKPGMPADVEFGLVR